MNKTDGGSNPDSEHGLGMVHPQIAAVLQARIDAELSRSWGVTLEECLPRTLQRMKLLFGEDIPLEQVEEAVRSAWGDT